MSVEGKDRDCGRISRDVTWWWIVAGMEILEDDCFPRIRCPYKTKGFAPRVSYFASLPSYLQPSQPIAQAPCIHISAIIKFASIHPNSLMELWCRSDVTLQRVDHN